MKTGSFLTLILFIFSSAIFATNPTSIISVDSDVISKVEKVFGNGVTELAREGGVSILKIETEYLPRLSYIMHKDFGRCPGYILHSGEDEGYETLFASKEREFAVTREMHFDYSINQQAKVNHLLNLVDGPRITKMIKKLSSYRNRFHTSKTGRESVDWLYQKWSELTEHRSDISISSVSHDNTPQKSIVLTIKGTTYPDEYILIGGHIDSVSGYFNQKNSKAPGADDNASGIATISEALNTLIQTDYRPKRTLQFIAYAAEEVGLRGSGSIAKNYKRNNVNVIGVLQLDMTNYKGSKWDIVFMTDFTNGPQNAFLGSLIDEYVKVPWGYDKCGYGCSDHASWTNNGFAASIPFEAKMSEYNHKIHTSRDTIKVSGGHSKQAVKFTKLAIAYIVELDR